MLLPDLSNHILAFTRSYKTSTILPSQIFFTNIICRIVYIMLKEEIERLAVL